MNGTLIKDLEQMHGNAEQIKSDAHRELSLAVGDNLRQGDVYVLRTNRLPVGKNRTQRQLAIGSTQGSRHVLEGEVAKLIDPDPADAQSLLARYGFNDVRPYQIGPAFSIETPATITHPEHGDRMLAEPGCYQVIYQKALDVEEREHREMD